MHTYICSLVHTPTCTHVHTHTLLHQYTQKSLTCVLGRLSIFFFFFKMHINWVRGDATNVSLDWELSWNYPFIFPPLRKSARLRPRVQPKSSRVRLCLTETTWHTGWGNWTVRGRSRSDEEKKKKREAFRGEESNLTLKLLDTW